MRNLTRKLFLSVCTLAICAVTLVSTTFAWYTTNTEVSATGMQGTTSAYGEASIFISADSGEDKTWAQSVTLTTNNTTILPVQIDNKGAVLNKGGTGAGTTDYLEFTLYVKTAAISDDSTQKIPLYLKNIKITNTTFATKQDDPNTTDVNELDAAIEAAQYDNLLYKNTSGKTGGVNKDLTKYWVDATRALWMNIDSTSDTELKGNVFDLKNKLDNPYADKGISGTADALEYYRTVTGETETTFKKPESHAVEHILGTEGVALEVAKLAENGDYVTLKFKIYLNGWDEYCFDACKEQSFSVEVSFTTKDDLAVKSSYGATA